MKYCHECGFENVDEAVYCRNCGVKLKKSDVSQKSNDNTAVIVNKNQNPIISKLFYKKDKYSGNLRIAKAKSISIAVFVIFFLWGLSIALTTISIGGALIVALIYGLIFAVVTYIIAFIIGWVFNRLTH